MPLLKRKLWTLDEVPPNVGPNDEVFVVRATREVFTSYEDYVRRMHLYATPQWQCRYTGAKDLTYDEAKESEEQSNELLAKFPSCYEEPVIRLVQHSTLSLDQLIGKIHAHYKDRLVPGEETFAEVEGKQRHCRVVRTVPSAAPPSPAPVPEAAGDSEAPNGATPAAASPPDEAAKTEGDPREAQYEVQWLEDGGSGTKAKDKEGTGSTQAPSAPAGGTAGATVPFSAIQRKKHPLVRSVLRRWILEVAEQKGGTGKKTTQFWMVKDELARRHGVAHVLPPELSAALSAELAAASAASAKRPAGSETTKSTPKKAKKAAGAEGAGGVWRPGANAALAISGAPVAVAPPAPIVPVEELVKRFQAGSTCACALHVLKTAGPAGASITEILEKTASVKDWSVIKDPRSKVHTALSTSPYFVKVGVAQFALRSERPDLPATTKGSKAASSSAAATPGPGPEPAPSAPTAVKADAAPPAPAAAAADTPGAPPPAPAAPKVKKEKKDPPAAPPKDGRPLKSARDKASRIRRKVEDLEAQLAEAVAARAADTPSKKAPESDEPDGKFEVPEHLLEFKGDPDDRKALMKHRRQLQEVEKLLASQREERDKGRREQERKNKMASESGVAKLQEALQEKKEQLAEAERAVAAAEDALVGNRDKLGDADAAKEAERLHRERVKQQEKEGRDRKKADEKAQREKQREAERLDREKAKEAARLAALEAKRYPMEDQELLQEEKVKAASAGAPPPAEPPVPGPLPDGAGWAVQSELLAVAEFLSLFGRHMDVKPASGAALADLTDLVSAEGASEYVTPLSQMYRDLLRAVLRDAAQHPSGVRRVRRWGAAVEGDWGDATWPEVLCRYLLAKREWRCGEQVYDAVRSMHMSGVKSLRPEQHATLLRHLCDDLLETGRMRVELEGRVEGIFDLLAQWREEEADARRKKRDADNAEKLRRAEEREEKQRMAEEAAMRGAADKMDDTGSEAGDDENNKDGDDGKAEDGGDGKADDGDKKKKAKKRPPRPKKVVDEGPVFAYTEEELEYKGAAGDRQALLKHKRWVDSERSKFEMERAVWEADNRRREKEERNRADLEARRKEKEAREEEDRRVRREDAYEAALTKVTIRVEPLGRDRHHRQYWWPLAGQKAVLYVEHPTGEWGCLQTEGQLQELFDSLNTKGVRERGLKESLEKHMGSMAYHIKRREAALERAAGTADPKKAKKGDGNKKDTQPAMPPERSSGRRAAGGVCYSETALASRSREAAAAEAAKVAKEKAAKEKARREAEAGPLRRAEEVAAEVISGGLLRVGELGQTVRASVPGGWKAWKGRVKDLGGEEADLEPLRAVLLEIEDALYEASESEEAAWEAEELEKAKAAAAAAVAADGEEGGSGAEEDLDEDMLEEHKKDIAEGQEWMENSSSDEEVEIKEEVRRRERRRRRASMLWWSARERRSWILDASAKGSSPARLAYGAATLEDRAVRMLEGLRKKGRLGKKPKK